MRKPTDDELPASYDRLISIGDLECDPYHLYNIDPCDDLVESIEKTGIKYPLVVRESGGGYLIIDGPERYQAAVQIGLSHLPCNISVREGAGWSDA